MNRIQIVFLLFLNFLSLSLFSGIDSRVFEKNGIRLLKKREEKRKKMVPQDLRLLVKIEQNQKEIPVMGDAGIHLIFACRKGDLKTMVQCLTGDEKPCFRALNKAFATAACHGHARLVDFLFYHSALHEIGVEKAFVGAAQRGHKLLVKKLERHPKRTTEHSVDRAFVAAARSGYDSIVAMLKGHKELTDCACNEAFWLAAQGGHEDIVNLLIDDVRLTQSVFDQALINAVAGKHEALVIQLCEHPNISQQGVDLAIDMISSDKKTPIFDVLYDHSKLTGAGVSSAFIRYAAQGFETLFEVFENDSRVSDQAVREAFFWAVRNKRIAIAKKLCNHRALTTQCVNSAAKFAAEKDCSRIIYMLINHEKLTTAANDIVLWGARHNNYCMIKFLQVHRNCTDITPATLQLAFLIGAEKGHVDVVNHLCDYLAQQDYIQKTIESGFLSAARNGHKKVLKRLISYFDQAYFHEVIEDALLGAAKGGHLRAVMYLSNCCFISYEIINKAADKAAERGRHSIVDHILNGSRFAQAYKHEDVIQLMYTACVSKRFKVLKIIFLKYKMDDKALHEAVNKAFALASQDGYLRLIKLIVKVTRLFEKLENYSIVWAVATAMDQEKFKIVTFVFKHPKLQKAMTSENFERAIIKAKEEGLDDLHDILIEQKKTILRK